jgi:riboflavin kinase/FMN adenylyltransferase
LADGRTIAAAINIGPNPTFGEQSHKVEVHLIDWHGALYGQPLEVDFHARLRDIQRFDGVEALKAQLNNDIEHARRILNPEP